MKPRKVSDEEAEEIKRILFYQDGKLYWREDRGWKISAGDRAGWLSKQGYRMVGIKRRHYQEHRLVWLLCNGCLPDDQIDHVNGIKDDNRIENLRDVNQSFNSSSFRMKRENTASIYRGVNITKFGHITAIITIKGKRKYIGAFKSEIEAAKAYDCAALKAGFSEARNFKEEA